MLPRGTLCPCASKSSCASFHPCESFRSSSNLLSDFERPQELPTCRGSAVVLLLCRCCCCCCCCLFDKYFDLLWSRKRPCQKTPQKISRPSWGQDLAAKSGLARPFASGGERRWSIPLSEPYSYEMMSLLSRSMRRGQVAKYFVLTLAQVIVYKRLFRGWGWVAQLKA